MGHQESARDRSDKSNAAKFVAFVLSKEGYAYNCKVPSCNARFADLTNLMDHRRLVHKHPKIKCQVKDCGREFTRYSNFLRHCDAHQVKATRDKSGKLLAPNYIAKCKARVYKNVLLLKSPVFQTAFSPFRSRLFCLLPDFQNKNSSETLKGLLNQWRYLKRKNQNFSFIKKIKNVIFLYFYTPFFTDSFNFIC